MHRLAVFDIDGTLTQTNKVDDECFLRAIGGVLGLDPASLDWSTAPHVTDSDLLRWLCETHCARAPTDAEMNETLRAFVALLREELGARPERFAPMPGARGLFAHLREHGWEVAVATGGWNESARLKLAVIGESDPDLILASSSDATTRVEIISVARRRAEARHGVTFARTVSIGDAPWDTRAAAELGWPFVGVGGRREALRAGGASVVLPDFADWDVVRAALEDALPPRHNSGGLVESRASAQEGP